MEEEMKARLLLVVLLPALALITADTQMTQKSGSSFLGSAEKTRKK